MGLGFVHNKKFTPEEHLMELTEKLDDVRYRYIVRKHPRKEHLDSTGILRIDEPYFIHIKGTELEWE